MTIGINEGTATNLKSTTDTGEEISHVRPDGGTVGVVSNLTNGTVRVSVGTVTTGSLTDIANLHAGTILTIGQRHADAFATVVSTGTNTLGTIRAGVAGSAIYVTDLVISAGSATNVEIASGGTSTGILGTLYLAANGGAVMNFTTPIRTASGSALVYKQSAAVSPLSITCGGYID